MKVIIGAGSVIQDGWISLQESELNLLNRENFISLFKFENTVDAFLAEHVFEHLSLEEAVIAAKNLYDFLKPFGHARIAVPDVNFKNDWYHNMCKPGGPGPTDHPAYTHKIFYDYKTLVNVFKSAGFQVKLLEYCDEKGEFHYQNWDEKDGKIGRSLRFDTRNKDGKLDMISLIIDAVKLID